MYTTDVDKTVKTRKKTQSLTTLYTDFSINYLRDRCLSSHCW